MFSKMIKYNGELYNLTNEDVISFNGICYQILTKKIEVGIFGIEIYPSLPFSMVNNLIEEGVLVEFKPSNKLYAALNRKYYMIIN